MQSRMRLSKKFSNQRASTLANKGNSAGHSHQNNDYPQHVEEKMRELTDNFRFQYLYPKPANLDESLKRLKEDLTEVPVLASDGMVSNTYSKIEAETILSRQDKDVIWGCLSIVRDTLFQMDRAERTHDPAGGYQWNMNWKHIRAELDQVLEAAKLLKLNGKETRDAMLASIFSDAIKNRQNFIIHNIHGAYGAALVASYFLNPARPNSMKSLERISRAVKEHQVAPPEFMANAVAILICQKLKLPSFDAESSPIDTQISLNSDQMNCYKVIRSIRKKIRDPYNNKHLNKDLTLIEFTNKERALLNLIGIEEWYVPHPANADSKIAHAVIAGDHSINYNHPEGFAKIALIRGPDTESIFEDPTVHHSLDSAIHSFADSFRVIKPAVQPLAMAGLRRTKTAVQRVIVLMGELFNGVIIGPRCVPGKSSGIERAKVAFDHACQRYPELFKPALGVMPETDKNYAEKIIDRVGNILQSWFDLYGDIPFTPKTDALLEPGPGKLPFWNTPLKYPPRDEDGQLTLTDLCELELKQFLFADKIREIAVELLRAEQWIFYVEPNAE